MKMIEAYEFKDLRGTIQKEVREKVTNDEVHWMLHGLTMDLDAKRISEAEYWETIGCSKYYGESTSWFVPSIYYEKHKKEVDKRVEKSLKTALFNAEGVIIKEHM